MDTTVDHFTLLALRVRGKNNFWGGFFFITSTITSNLFLAVPEVLALRTVSFIPSVHFQNNHSDRPF